MTKTKKSNSYTLRVSFIPLFILGLILSVEGIFFVNRTLEEGGVLGVSNKSKSEKVVKGNSIGKKIENVDTKNLKAQEHLIKVQGVLLNLKDIADEEEVIGNEEVSNEIEEIAEEVEDNAVDTTEPLEELEDQPQWKTILMGTDYKNLGQLRSSMVKAENGIRKLTRTMEKLKAKESDTVIQEQIGVLNQERERIGLIIKENEESFSLLGWISKLLSGYEDSDTVTETTQETAE